MKTKIISLVIILFALSQTAIFSQDLAGKVLDVKKVMKSGANANNLVQISKPAIDFTFEVDGKTVKFSEYTKGKIVFLNFWGTWCGPCRNEIPAIMDIQKEMADDVIVIGIALERRPNDKPKVEQFSQSKGLNYLNFMRHPDLEAYYGQIAYNMPNIASVPTTFLIDKDGMVVSYKKGGQSKQAFVNWIKTAM